MKHDMWHRVAEYVGRSLGSQQIGLLDEYAQWLATEGLEAGGIGPSEIDRLDSRHIGDSLAFAAPLPESPELIWDLGSGVGMPGIPLAVLLPETRVVLVDRSERRVELARRAVRVLNLSNAEVKQADISDLRDIDVAVSRAALPPEEMAEYASRWLNPRGTVVQGGSWRAKPVHEGWETREIPRTVLDYPVWLLIMRRCG